jgi:hypothetical protein
MGIWEGIVALAPSQQKQKQLLSWARCGFSSVAWTATHRMERECTTSLHVSYTDENAQLLLERVLLSCVRAFSKRV